MNRIERDPNAPVPKRKKQKQFKVPRSLTKATNQSTKKTEFVAIQYLSQKGGVYFKLARIISGNLIVLNNKVHVLNPKHMWRHGKMAWYIIREIDRMPVSNEDYDQIKARGHDTEGDVPLIKAVLGAVQKPGIEGPSKNMWTIIGIAVVALVVILVLFG